MNLVTGICKTKNSIVRTKNSIVGHFKTLTTYGISALTHSKTKNSIGDDEFLD
jgi:hypothetical protein